MAGPLFYDLVEETTSTGGTGTFTLAGATSGHRSFSVVGNANTCYYFARGSTPTEWEVGLGTYTSSGTTLARTTVLASSNSGSAVNFTGTGITVRLIVPATWFSGITSSKLIQRVYTTFSSDLSTSATIPEDDTIPQSSEGTQIGTLSITPTSTNNYLLIRWVAPLVGSNINQSVIFAMFKDSGANAIQAAHLTFVGSSYGLPCVMEYIEQCSSTSSQTFKIRYGSGAGAGTTYVNRDGFGALFGSTLPIATLVIEEWAP